MIPIHFTHFRSQFLACFALILNESILEDGCNMFQFFLVSRASGKGWNDGWWRDAWRYDWGKVA